jgi:hypothetical protein
MWNCNRVKPASYLVQPQCNRIPGCTLGIECNHFSLLLQRGKVVALAPTPVSEVDLGPLGNGKPRRQFGLWAIENRAA